MLKKNSKPMFYILLTPFYILIQICLIGMSAGSIEWVYVLVYSLSMIIAAWCLSRHNSLIINMIYYQHYFLI